MKAVVVLDSGSDQLPVQAALAADLLADLVARSRMSPAGIETWFLYENEPPEQMPRFDLPLSHIRLIRNGNRHIPEAGLHLLAQAAGRYPADLFLFDNSGPGEERAVRVAARLGGTACLQVEALVRDPQGLRVTKPAYAANLKADLVLTRGPFCITPGNKKISPVPMALPDCPVSDITDLDPFCCDWVTSLEVTRKKAQAGLDGADIILAAGQGVGSRDNMKRIEQVARTLGAAVGASRPVVMNAWSGMDTLIGVSGWTVAPKVCIAAGISGAGAFTAGMAASTLKIGRAHV